MKPVTVTGYLIGFFELLVSCDIIPCVNAPGPYFVASDSEKTPGQEAAAESQSPGCSAASPALYLQPPRALPPARSKVNTHTAGLLRAVRAGRLGMQRATELVQEGDVSFRWLKLTKPCSPLTLDGATDTSSLLVALLT